ncbi:penicillin acylase family protein [Indioceanicola profundi]|uniref:penicillin acylase family protein n=1 Tax=Indioceanicola profundi TaxID=2220096 RepID=UPI000E6AA115|nr:penicillin acylase family protein [Indioceanicola profundi]
MGKRRGAGARVARGLGYMAAGVAVLAVLAGAAGYGFLRASLPRLDGVVETPGIASRVTVQRDAGGIATIIAADRADMARALGYLHGQERFFQMDLLRRSAAGELAVLVGDAALPLDRDRRLHRFRTRAGRIVAAMQGEDRRILDAYVAGVNQGFGELSARPFEYAILRHTPEPWRAEDTMLATFAMYFDLQDSSGARERNLDAVTQALGPDWAAFLYPSGTDFDAALDGTSLPEPPLPAALPAGKRAQAVPRMPDPEHAFGSNNWAVGGGLTGHGGAMVADDMHLGHSVPNIWFRTRLVLTGPAGEIRNDIVGVSLPGAPNIVVGSNGHIAWGFTNTYIDTGDAVRLEPGAEEGTYRTPDGNRRIERVTERLCTAADTCEELVVEETVWGPVVGADSNGAKLAWHWVAHDMDAGAMGGLLALEQARSVDEAIGIAHRTSLPNQNLMVGDRDGNIAWTIIGRVPRRFGFDGSLPESWADGTKGWNGWLEPAEVPVVRNPDHSRLWTANSRTVGGEDFARLGDGGYAHGNRARQIRELLFAKDRFTEADHLAIQLDDRAVVLERWQTTLLAALDLAKSDPEAQALRPYVQDWGGRAVPDSVGYRLVRQFRTDMLRLLYENYLGIPLGERPAFRRISTQADGPAWRLLQERPAHLVPPGFESWDAVLRTAVASLLQDVEQQAGGDPASYRWGERNRPGVRHPLSRFVPGLALLTDPEDDPLPGDVYQPRAQGRGFGASQRMVVSPGHERDGIFHMPGSQSGHPLSPYYLKGHQDWREGRPSPLLPGPAEWTLNFELQAAP